MSMNASLSIDATVTSKVYGDEVTVVQISVSPNEVDLFAHTPEAVKALEVVLRDAANLLEQRITDAADPDFSEVEEQDQPTCEDCQGTGIGQSGDPDTSRCTTCGGRGYHIFKEEDDDSAFDRARDKRLEEENDA